MKHKLISIAGITLIILALISCRKTDIVSIKKISYVYRNASGVNVTLEVYNPSAQIIKEYTILNGEQIITHATEDEGIGIFAFENNENMLGDSVVVIFEGNKCISYLRSVPDKIFDVKKYDNYSENLVSQKEFSLMYTITESDYDSAQNCLNR